MHSFLQDIILVYFINLSIITNIILYLTSIAGSVDSSSLIIKSIAMSSYSTISILIAYISLYFKYVACLFL